MKNRLAVGTIMDITQDALLRQELSDKIRQLEDLNDELSTFAFAASHDLREPLRKIKIFSNWICQEEAPHLSPNGVDRFNRITTAIDRMDALIDNILNFSQVNALKPLYRTIDLNHSLETAIGDLQEMIQETNTVIEADPLPAIQGDPLQFAQLFQNLLGNAIKYHKSNVQPHIRITCTKIDGRLLEHAWANHGLQYAKISFADNGIGFEQQYAKKIFQMFRRLHGIHEYPGTGMGLAICKKIMQCHGGFITAESTPGEGAVFECFVPLQTETAPNETEGVLSPVQQVLLTEHEQKRKFK
jgi:light-regulated signal transduction histidine kinase (bacteriophytochrome)